MLMPLLWLFYVTTEHALAFFFFFKWEGRRRKRREKEGVYFAPGGISYKPEWSKTNAVWLSSHKRELVQLTEVMPNSWAISAQALQCLWPTSQRPGSLLPSQPALGRWVAPLGFALLHELFVALGHTSQRFLVLAGS